MRNGLRIGLIFGVEILVDWSWLYRDLLVVTPEEDAADALAKLAERDVRQLPVVHNERLAGLMRRRDIMRWLQLRSNIQMV
jgi:predicted transcriptional regulator